MREMAAGPWLAVNAYTDAAMKISVQTFQEAIGAVEWRDPFVDANAVRGLKFSAALPADLAVQTLGTRIGDTVGAQSVLAEQRSIGR